MEAFGAVATAPWHVEYLRVVVPDPGDEDVVVRVTHSWISNGTEGSFIRGERIGGDTPRAASDPLPFPHISGYQKVGIVEKVGSKVSHVAPGDKVFATVSSVDGMFYSHAGHVSPAITHRSQVWKLPITVDPVAASGLVLTQVGYNVGTCGSINAGDLAVVIGDGMVGHWSAQTLKHRGASVLMLGRHNDRLSRFTCDEGDRVVNTNDTDAVDAVLAWAGGPGRVQLVADTVGSIPTLDLLMPTMRRFSHIVSAGFYGSTGFIDIQRMRNYEMSLHAPSGWTTERIDSTLALLEQGVLQTTHLITHRFPVSEAAAAFDLILQRNAPVLGVVLDWPSAESGEVR